MRIVAGQFKGRVLASPPGRGTRPTTDRVREALFSALWARLPQGGFAGAHVLDAFAGSGALGLEALSRGASSCAFVEHDPSALKALRANIASLFLPREAAAVYAADAFSACAQGALPARAAAAPFSLVLLDPPYAVPASEVAGLLSALAGAGALAPGAIVSYEHAREDAGEAARAISELPGFSLDAAKRYGKTSISLFAYAP